MSGEVIREWKDHLESLVALLDHEYATDGRVRGSLEMYGDHTSENGVVSH